MENEVFNCDCLAYMRNLPDNHFDLCIADPPYGIERFKKGNSRVSIDGNNIEWDKVPTKEVFDEIMRTSKYVIIWGANNFSLPKTEYFIVWNKEQSVDNFASLEYAWTNVKIPAKMFTYSIHKCIAERKKNGGKIHPTQKPVALYSWLLQNYAKKGDKIFDPFLGSGSSRIAAYKLGFDFVGCELDENYYQAQNIRFEKECKGITQLSNGKKIVEQNLF